MANNWYSKDDWYSPLQSVPTVNAVTPKEKKKNKKVRIISGICLLLVLLVATSLIFAERSGGQSGFGSSVIPSDGESGDMPENWQDWWWNGLSQNLPQRRLPMAYTTRRGTAVSWYLIWEAAPSMCPFWNCLKIFWK